MVVHSQSDLADQALLLQRSKGRQGLIQDLPEDLGRALAVGADIDVMQIGDVEPGQAETLQAVLDAAPDARPAEVPLLDKGQAVDIAKLLARHVCDRLEESPHLARQAPVSPGVGPQRVADPALKYVNRLSDFLFVASRYLNKKASGDVLWVPGKNR